MIMGFEMKDTRLLVDFDFVRNAAVARREGGTGPAVVWIVIIDEEKRRGTAFSLRLLCTS